MYADTELTGYLNKAVARIVKQAVLAAVGNPRELAFLMHLGTVVGLAQKKRGDLERSGQHIPPFLICSITSHCNLFCTGCYARANSICSESNQQDALGAGEWKSIFDQAVQVGIAFALLAGGEPLIRHDVLLMAAQTKDMVFPIFTNGTLLDAEYLELFNNHRNLIPVISLEGTQAATDARRGPGTYEKLMGNFQELQEKKLLYGVSLTVTKENLPEITSPSFVDTLATQGCHLVFFIEYVPVDALTRYQAFDDADRRLLESRQQQLRERYPQIIFLSFPGDEKKMGGCLAAGRGFFHINTNGAAENCPFSPYSDRNVRDTSLLEALKSPLFSKLREGGLVGGEHTGGCALFEQQDQVLSILNQL
jgi:MoaA/NifB/PqqE/SkfB family radical SAM enzyme